MRWIITRAAIASISVILVGVISAPPSQTAAGNFLYWAKTPVKTGSMNTCYDIANDAMRQLNFQNVRRSSIEVAGSSGGTYAAITCIGTTPRVTAVVMVVGGNANETLQVRDRLRDKVASIIRFD